MSEKVDRAGIRGAPLLVESEDLHQRLETLEETQRATLNILEDFDEEKMKFQQIQQATMNLLEDFDEERQKFQMVQKATLNLLEDVHAERNRLQETQHALMNILDDVEVERVKAEQASVRLAAVNKELEAFSYSVSHDLRAPLRAISGFAQAAVEDCAPLLDEAGKRYLNLVQENAHKMGQLIDDLLTFSRLGRQQKINTEIDMESLAKEVFGELAAQAPKRKLKLLLVGSVPTVYGDKAMIRQVLMNLLGNAVKFTKPRDLAIIEFGYAAQPDGGAYYVKDNGVGFDMQYAGNLFGVFQRLHSVEEFEGTGVGLALVSRIITRHMGRVWAESKEGEGATFFFALPEGETR